jgi:hypothetical protein
MPLRHNLQAMGWMVIAIFKYCELTLKRLLSHLGYRLQSESFIIHIHQIDHRLPSTWQ